MTPHVDVGDDRPRRTDRPAAYPGITAFVSAASSWPADHPSATAAVEAGVRTVALQWEDPATDESNNVEVDRGWGTKWFKAGSAVVGWWRVEHYYAHTGDDIANAESDREIALLPKLIEPPSISAVFTLGKRPGVPVPLLNQHGIVLFIECFREGPQSDTTITNCWAWWKQAGMNMDLVRPCLQAYGEPFATLGEQSDEARECGAAGIGIFPAELVSEDGWRQIGKTWA